MPTPPNFLVDDMVNHTLATPTSPDPLDVKTSKTSQQLLPVMLGKTHLMTWLD